MFIDITNLQKSSAMISTFRVEAMNANGAWVTLPQLPTSTGISIYTQNIPPPKLAVEVSIERLDELIHGHNFSPNETVRGWAFFDNSLSSRFYFVRISIEDFTGNSYTSAPLTMRGAPAQDVVLRPTGKRKDLTTLKMEDHCG
jgi:hypothetical protein